MNKTVLSSLFTSQDDLFTWVKNNYSKNFEDLSFEEGCGENEIEALKEFHGEIKKIFENEEIALIAKDPFKHIEERLIKEGSYPEHKTAEEEKQNQSH